MRPQRGKIKDKEEWMMTKSQAWKDPSVTEYIPFCKLKSENVMHEVTMSAHGKDKMMIFDGFGEPKGHTIGAAQTVG